MRIPKGKDFRKKLMTVADEKAAMKENLLETGGGNVFFACVCGSREWNLIQKSDNIGAICVSCNRQQIIAWNINGHILNLKTQVWSFPKATLKMEENL